MGVSAKRIERCIRLGELKLSIRKLLPLQVIFRTFYLFCYRQVKRFLFMPHMLCQCNLRQVANLRHFLRCGAYPSRFDGNWESPSRISSATRWRENGGSLPPQEMYFSIFSHSCCFVLMGFLLQGRRGPVSDHAFACGPSELQKGSKAKGSDALRDCCPKTREVRNSKRPANKIYIPQVDPRLETSHLTFSP